MAKYPCPSCGGEGAYPRAVHTTTFLCCEKYTGAYGLPCCECPIPSPETRWELVRCPACLGASEVALEVLL